MLLNELSLPEEGNLDPTVLRACLLLLVPQAGDMSPFWLPDGVKPLCANGDLQRQVRVAMPPCDVVGPMEPRASPGSLHIPRTAEAGGARERPAIDPEDRATGKRPCRVVGTSSTPATGAASAVAGQGSSGGQHLLRSDGTRVGTVRARQLDGLLFP